MELKEYLAKGRGLTTKFAKQLGVPVSSLSAWATGARPIPVVYCFPIEEATDGAVTRRELRPDDWHMIWPELKEATHA